MHCRISFLCLGSSTVTIVLSNFLISYISLLLILSSNQLEIAVMVVWYHTCLCYLLIYSGSALNELLSLISCSHCFLSGSTVFLPLVHGVTLRFLLEVTTVQLSSWCASSLFPSLSCDISMFISFVSVFSCSSLIGCLLVEPMALFIKYVSPLLVILIGGICIFHDLVIGVYFTAFSSLLPHFH